MIHLFKRLYVSYSWQFEDADHIQYFLTKQDYPSRIPEEPGKFMWFKASEDPIKEFFGKDIPTWLDSSISDDKKVVLFMDDDDVYRILAVHYRSLFPSISDDNLYHLLTVVEFADNPIYRGNELINNPYNRGANFKINREWFDTLPKDIVPNYVERIGYEQMSFELILLNWMVDADKWNDLVFKKFEIFNEDTLIYVQHRLQRELARLGLRLGLSVDDRIWKPDEYESKMLSNPLLSWVIADTDLIDQNVYRDTLTPDVVRELTMDYVLKSRIYFNTDDCRTELNRFIDLSTFLDLYPAIYNRDYNEVARLTRKRGLFIHMSNKVKLNEFLAENLIKLQLSKDPLIDDLLL